MSYLWPVMKAKRNSPALLAHPHVLLQALVILVRPCAVETGRRCAKSGLGAGRPPWPLPTPSAPHRHSNRRNTSVWLPKVRDSHQHRVDWIPCRVCARPSAVPMSQRGSTQHPDSRFAAGQRITRCWRADRLDSVCRVACRSHLQSTSTEPMEPLCTLNEPAQSRPLLIESMIYGIDLDHPLLLTGPG